MYIFNELPKNEIICLKDATDDVRIVLLRAFVFGIYNSGHELSALTGLA